jgi:signal transduction histidine kinase
MAAAKSFDSVKLNDLFKEKDFQSLNLNYDPKNFEDFKEGSVIYSSGSQSEFVYLLIVGEVKIKFTIVKKLLVKSMNDFFGDNEILEEKNRNSSAVANTDCTVYKIDADAFRKLINVPDITGIETSEPENIVMDDGDVTLEDDFRDQELESDIINPDTNDEIDLNVDNYEQNNLPGEIPDSLDEKLVEEETETYTETAADKDQPYFSNQQTEIKQGIEHEIVDQNLITPDMENQSFIQDLPIIENIPDKNQTPSVQLISKFILSDVKAPLLTIKHYTSLIPRFNPSEEVQKIVSLLSTQTTSILDLLQSSIEYSEKSIQPKLEKLSFNDSMNNILTLLSDYVESRNVKLFKKFDVDAEVNIDQRKFYVACYHIARFACDNMPDGGNLYFSSQHDGENILLSIKDVSHGIKEELIDKIFEPVYKDGEEEKTGLGLAIARYILESMNYNLKLESSITGTIYTIVLPKDSH